MIGRMAIQSTQNLQYAFDPVRAAHYSEDMRRIGRGAARQTAMWLMNASMHDTLSRRTSERAALPEANRAVCQNVLLMLRPNLFDSLGTLKSSWLHQLESGGMSGDQALRLGHDNGEQPDEVTSEWNSEQSHFERWYQ
jgi:hypothetical protein